MSAIASEPASPDVQRPLGVLESSGLIRLAAVQPELEYLFRHVLVQDAAYETLLKQERRRLHLAVAETLEDLYPDRRDELAGMLAWHYEAASEPERALPLLIAAGGYALRRFANTEGYGFFVRAKALLATSDDPEVVRHRVEVGLGIARSGWVSLGVPELLANLEEIAPLADRLADPTLIGQVQLWTSIVYWQRGDSLEEGSDFIRMLHATLETADKVGDRQLRGMALAMMGRALTFSDEPRRAIEPLEEAISLTSARDPIGSALAADSLAQTYAILGDFEKADAVTATAFELARQSGDPISEIDAQISRSQVEVEKGNLEEAVRLARDGAARASALGVMMCTLVGNYFAGSAELELGHANLAVQPLQISHDLAIEANAGWWKNMASAALSTSSCALGDPDAARSGWDEALDVAVRSRDRGAEAAIRYQRAVTLSRSPDPDWAAIAADLEWTLQVLEAAGARPREARARVEYAHVLDQLGRGAEASEQRDRAERLFAELGIPAPPSRAEAAG